VIFFLTLCYLYKLSKERPPNFPPGPPRLPVWGSYWFVLQKNYKYLHIGFHKLAQKYKTSILGLYLGPIPAVVVHDYDSIRQVVTRPEFQGRFKVPVFNKRSYNKNLGIIFTDEQFWVEQRRFTLRYMREFGFGRRFAHLEDVMKEEMQDMLDVLNGRRQDKEIFSDGLTRVPTVFIPVVLNAMWHMFAGQRFSTKEHGRPRYFAHQAFRTVWCVDVTGNALAQTDWIRYFAPYYSGYTDLIESAQNMQKFMEEAITEHKATYSDDYARDFIDIYLKEKKKREKPEEISSFSDEQLAVIGVDILFPAATTVSTTLNFAMVFLLNYPSVQRKMQQEVDIVVGRDRLPTLDDRARLPYIEAFLREVMRKQTLVPMAIVHRATEDTALNGYFIPKDTAVVLNLWSFHNDPNFWGDPEAFRPERFMDEKGELLKKDYSLPFGAGKRLCAGETFARQTMFLIVSNLIQNFTVKAAPGKPLPSEEPDMPGFLVTKKDIWLQFEPRA